MGRWREEEAEQENETMYILGQVSKLIAALRPHRRRSGIGWSIGRRGIRREACPYNTYNSYQTLLYLRNLVFTTEALTGGASSLLSGPSTTVAMVAGIVMLGFAFVL